MARRGKLVEEVEIYGQTVIAIDDAHTPSTVFLNEEECIELIQWFRDNRPHLLGKPTEFNGRET